MSYMKHEDILRHLARSFIDKTTEEQFQELSNYMKAVKAAAGLDNYLDPNEASVISDTHGIDFLQVMKDIKSYRASMDVVNNKEVEE